MSLQMSRSWTDERLDDLALSLGPLPVQVAKLAESVDRLEEDVRSLREELREETVVFQQELAASQRQFVQVGWSLVATLVAAATALITVLV